MRRVSVLAVLAAATVSCQLVYGLGDFHSTGSTSGGAAGQAAGGGGAGTGGATSGSGAGGPEGGAPACSSNAGAPCIPTAPSGFAGYFHLVDGPTGTAPTSCASGASPKQFFDGAPTPGCTDCGCGSVPAVPCTAPELDYFIQSNCPASGSNFLDDGSTDCKGPLFGSYVKSGRPKENACTANGGALKSPGWTTAVTLCEIATGGPGCAADEVCAPANEPVCTVQAGTLADCPQGWGTPRVVYTDAQDDRTCGACVCTPAFTCTSTYVTYGGGANVCVGSGTDLAPGSCVKADYAGYALRPTTGPQHCDPSGGEASGSFAPTGATTICCRTP